MDLRYEIGKHYYFKISSINESFDTRGREAITILVECDPGIKIRVRGHKWQKKEFWNFDNLKCEVKSIDNQGIPFLVNTDFRHPNYQEGEIYNFKVIDSIVKKNKDGEFNVFLLKGIDGCIHEVKMFPGQQVFNKKIDNLNCKVNKISYHLSLSQVYSKDIFFFSFNEIVSDPELERKYFTCFFDENSNQNFIESKYVLNFKEQYKSQQSFWVFTYVNKVLKHLFDNNINTLNYKNSIEINNLIRIFQEWILTKGIIKSIYDEKIRSNTKLKSQYQLRYVIMRDEILNLLFKNPFDYLKKIDLSIDHEFKYERIFCFLLYCNFELVDLNSFYDSLIKILSIENSINEDIISKLKRIIVIINSRKKILTMDSENESFSLISKNFFYSNFTSNENKFLFWSYIELLISEKINYKEHFNITTGNMLKFFTRTQVVIENKETILYNAYQYFDNFNSKEITNVFRFSSIVELSPDLIISRSSSNFHPIQSPWYRLSNFYKENISFEVLLVSKSNSGYEVLYDGIKGFLPNHYFKNKLLKSSYFDYSSCTISCKCISLSSFFNFFIITQDENIINLNGLDELKKGEVYEAIIKSIVDYGVFIITKYGESLLHFTAVSNNRSEFINDKKFFKIGSKLKVVFVESFLDGKLSFSFKILKDIDSKYYNNFFNESSLPPFVDLFDTEIKADKYNYFDKAVSEKAKCIEQFAVLQFDLNLKLENLKIAKQFYVNVNSARSYLLNIYISYFEILLKIDNLLKSNEIDDIILIRKDAIVIKNRIKQKTIDVFPDSEKIVYFLDILSLFNLYDIDSINLLYRFVIENSNSTYHKDLRTIAKVALANNLLLSETIIDNDFILKNLRLIFNYLSEGVLSLKESTEDKLFRELEQERLFWKQKIIEDESETLEFKSSLFTPTENNTINLKNNSKDLNELKNPFVSNSILIHSALKTLVAFANSNGGTLLIGVNNDKVIIGIDFEYKSKYKSLKSPNRDGYGLLFDDLIRNYIGDSFSSLLERKFLKFPEGDILIVTVKKSSNEVFLLKDKDGNSKEQFYIRNLSSSKELVGYELTKFLKNRFYNLE